MDAAVVAEGGVAVRKWWIELLLKVKPSIKNLSNKTISLELFVKDALPNNKH